MGNRAVITTEDKKIGIYIHWNGGRDSVEAFLEYCKRQGFRCPENDNYGWARLCQVIANFMGDGGLSVGIDAFEYLDLDSDNGTYVIRNWEIVDRINFDGTEQDVYPMTKMLEQINEAQPEAMRLQGEELRVELSALDRYRILISYDRDKINSTLGTDYRTLGDVHMAVSEAFEAMTDQERGTDLNDLDE